MRVLLIAALLTGWASAHAAAPQPQVLNPAPGAPGTATPSPYPQITPSSPPRQGAGKPGGPALPPMPLPGPPKDQPLAQPAQTPSARLPGRD
ncbi:hypothetical protein [Pseudomonas cremoricolorata]|uniref:Lipoprotein n=1 Tax=Pseudomonas cremoricolorata TaxID=157783 RepID=A0A089WN08_9PSED|nr:hypothetical protein [Pseudomonas cremoricolorata]AIR89991.1 hypothetical protein LK03_12090 [Pseudomonas cremoricolorata]